MRELGSGEMTPRIVSAELGHIQPMVERVSGAQKRNMVALCEARNISPADMLVHACEASHDPFCALDDEGPIALGGCVLTPAMSGGTFVWMLGIMDAIEQHKKWFLRESREHCERMSNTYGPLWVNVDDQEYKSLRWLSWLGFVDVDKPVEWMGRTLRRLEKPS